MKSKKEKVERWHLLLEKEERDIIRGIIQNPLSDDEDPKLTEFREELWKALE